MSMDKSYIHLFNTVAEYEEARKNNYYEPWVSYTKEVGGEGLAYNKTEQEKKLEKPLTFNILSDGYFCFTCESTANTKTIQYSINNGEWTNLTSNINKEATTAITVDGLSGTFIYGGYDEDRGEYYWEYDGTKLYYYEPNVPVGEYVHDENWEYEYEVLTSEGNFIGEKIDVVTGDVVRFRGDNATYADFEDSDRVNYFETTCNLSIEGNIMSLINSTGYKSETTLVSANTFNSLFNACPGLTSAENLILPATTLAESCYIYMFNGCTNLTTAPELPATTLAGNCYQGMFYNCTGLTTAPELPATTLAGNCYERMFNGCTSLTAAPELPATTLAQGCYQFMFDGCTSLTKAPELPATTLADFCYYYMFNGCTSLTTAPELPATTLAYECYNTMFAGCTSLTTAPSILPATTLTEYCYGVMFSNCTSLTTAPELPATTLTQSCYSSMFSNCSSLTTAPALPATTLANGCYRYMFYGCTSLNHIKCLATNISASYCTTNWVNGVSSTGTFVKDVSMTEWTTGNNGIPNGWNIEKYGFGLSTYNILTSFRGSTKEITITSSNNPWTATTQDNWITLSQNTGQTGDTNITVTISSTSSPRSGSVVFSDGNKTSILIVEESDILIFNIISAGTIYWKAKNSNYCKTIQYKKNGGDWVNITSTTGGTSIPVNAGEAVQFRGDNATYSSGSSYYNYFSASFNTKFEVEGDIMSLIDSTGYATATTLASSYTFYRLFENCAGLTSAENLILPATTLTEYCYSYMFWGCSSLATAPELPATTLTAGCYSYMFFGCTSLTTAPELPATTLAKNCYYGMFSNCSSLTTAPALPSTTLAQGCYNNMFEHCSRLKTASELSATTLAQNCYSSMFSNCSSLTTAPALPATTLTENCYGGMFQSCTSLTTAPELPATTLAKNCYSSMFSNCSSLTTAPELPATTLASYCYDRMFFNCTSLNYIKCLATDISASYCTYDWVNGVASTGTFVKNASMSWTTGYNGIPANWTVQNA